MNESDGPAKLVSVASDIEASIIANALREMGIEATTAGGFISGFKAEAPGEVVVYVPRKQLEKAERALDELREQRDEFDWSQVDVDVPE
jgi:hypothetical protein